jgi:ATP-dependent DNA helicase RecQ
LTFQVPALLLDGLTLVVSPLIALMRDQVSVLRDKGIPAAAWDSSIDAAEVGIIRKGLKDGSLKILYVAP